ncbi:HlyD family efflux transporter periplasmic adaptor subunit [Rugamonas sp.]|uniref:efflux RND transporter periplasmic adaptor subunit n=1 Tax=Rugamonas sp. TaxID=1926287 RepID=UPI0025EE1269|nr:HlyD family efflux transporter periplasmic adaptor subunit [Rugamonas sp.]
MDQPISRRSISRRQRHTVIVIAAVLASACAAAWGINRAVTPSVEAGSMLVSEVRLSAIANTVSASGIVIPVHEELVSSAIVTRVAKVRARAGQPVAAGELLLELDDGAVRLAIDAIKEQLAQQDNRVTSLTLELDQKRRQLGSGIELLELDLEATRVRLGRLQTLRKSGAVSGEDLMTAELNVKRNEIQLRQQHEQIADSRRVTQSAIDGARLQHAILLKQLQQQEQLLAQTRVRAPFAGMLTWLLADEGASVNVGQLVAKVSELDNFKVEASLSDFHARALSPGLAVRVEQGGQVLAGRVQTVLPEIQDGTVKLLVTLDQPHHPMLRNKLRVDVNIVTEQRSGVLVADGGPAINGRGRQALFVLRDGAARKTMIEVGAGDGKAVEIVSGAKAGDRIIVSDLSRYKELDSIRIVQ